jgi:CheY-like chemotaxis protein
MPTVLIIEDDQLSRDSFAALIQHGLGYDVVTAEGGEQALGLLRSGLMPGLIVLDLALPWMDGFAFREQQLADPGVAHCPILVCSGQLDAVTDLERLRGAAYLEKPIEPDVFLRFVRAFCQP